MSNKSALPTCTRRIQFCAGHRVHGHESKCAHLHGHNYVVLITAEPLTALDSIGRTVDFSVLKEKIGGWIDKHWDHGFILFNKDVEGIAALNTFQNFQGRRQPGFVQKLYLMKSNPTAENMAQHLLEDVCPPLLADYNIRITQVRLWETENCYADAVLGKEEN